MTAALTAERPESARPAMRLVPVPRSEPPSDDELGATGVPVPPLTAVPLPLDLATGAQVRRGRRSFDRVSRGTGRGRTRSVGGPGSPGGAGAAGPDDAWLIGGAGRPPVATGPVAPGRVGTAGPAGTAGRADTAARRPVGCSSGREPTSGEPDDEAPASTGGAGADKGRAASPQPGDEAREAVELRAATRLFVATCVEVFGGFRPIAQLRPLCVPDRFESIASRRLRPGARATGRGYGATRTSIIAGQDGPPRAGRVAPTGPGERVMVRRVQVCDVLNGVAEIAVVMSRREKVWALALRMELVGGRWLCCHLEVV